MIMDKQLNFRPASILKLCFMYVKINITLPKVLKNYSGYIAEQFPWRCCFIQTFRPLQFSRYF